MILASSLVHTPEPHASPRMLPSDRADLRNGGIRPSGALRRGAGQRASLRMETLLPVPRGARPFVKMFREIGWHSVLHSRIPWLPTLLREWVSPGTQWPTLLFPDWFDADLDRRLELRNRWDRYVARIPFPRIRCNRQDTFLSSSLWPFLFERFDPANTRSQLDVRHPYRRRAAIAFPARGSFAAMVSQQVSGSQGDARRTS